MNSLSGPSFQIEPMPVEAGKKTNFGAVVQGLDLNNIADADVQALKEAVWRHKVVVVKGQRDLQPIKQWELVTRWDPEAPQVHSHGSLSTFNKQGGLLAVSLTKTDPVLHSTGTATDTSGRQKSRDVHGIPGAENVRLIGKGYQGADHYGLLDKTVTKPLSHDWHVTELPAEEFAKGHTRFQRWHLDAPLYDRDPAWFTTLRCLKRPTSPNVTIHWDDGSGQAMEVEPGLTAFFSNVQCYELMTAEEKVLADHSWVEYAPMPYLWMSACRGSPNGLGVASEGKEKSLEDLGEYDEAKVKRYPMVWVNPVTGERAFMVHGMCVRKMHLRKSLDEEPTVVDDVVEIRKWLKPIQERVLKPEYIMLPRTEEGDMVIWANYQMFHTAVDYPDSFGPRSMHQANIGASKGPIGLFSIPVAA
ncbi:Taurine catabolism dioxygenase TauD, TfdA family [Geosmithia morbida]|uniref:Taurine catabolism dioxygenase TauD, TfdA family n=1 Tax=Geosmithia morbida TaxID=1094350 RepID=A0A9P4Z1R1_9HYPO|nr:Taurine catabolism dioxygenase TauD, TfdA family [Geosmithia morbida]KAF4125816.1 Taurine catabolism dioxygenase TauD, TfdA family [Geosmithia morbida]